MCLAIAVNGAKLIVLNQLSSTIQLTLPEQRSIAAGEHAEVIIGAEHHPDFGGAKVALTEPQYADDLPKGTHRYAVLAVAADGFTLHDTNDLQVELSAAAHKCKLHLAADKNMQESYSCMSANTFNGLPVNLLQAAFGALWSSKEYWHLCNELEPAKPLSTTTSIAGHKIDILRKNPVVASIRGFMTPEGCKDLLGNHAGLDSLVVAHVGTGGGSTSTSESRETLTNNMFINWDQDNILTRTGAATFDVVSEMLGKEMPYEGQEPVNFLHYIKGFEYKPHTDGWGGKRGKRVATTLVYCEAANVGGGTVFPRGDVENPPLRYQPSSGDMLYFEYQPNPGLQEHAACPVIEGNKSTLTQWHRLGVSPEEPWDKFEDWGEYHNPHMGSRWRGPRYGKPAHKEL
jgi:prolyl 4-hydroxylase